MNNTYIKLYRNLRENDLISDPLALSLFVFLLLSADRSTGKYTTGRYILAEALKRPPTTVYSALSRLEKRYKVISLSSNNKRTEISLLNWAKYQSENDPSTTNQQQIDTKQEYKNIKETNISSEILVKKRSSVSPAKAFHNTPAYLVNLPLEEIPVLKKNTRATARQVVAKAQDIHNWYLSNPRRNRRDDWRAVLRNALRRDFPPGPDDDLPTYDELKAKGAAW